MKRVYLSSYQFGQASQELTELAGAGTPAVVVMNALDIYGSRRPEQVEANVSSLAELGIPAEELDLRDYFGQPDRLREALVPVGLIWATGGNAFVLRRAMRASGLDDIVSTRVAEGSLMWAGFSAGAVVATPTLKGIELVDDCTVIPEGYEDTEIVWGGLGLVNYSIAPHYQSEHPESEAIELVVERFKADRMPYRTLRDGEAILVNGDDERVVGLPLSG